jgi:L-aspartate oxidase
LVFGRRAGDAAIGDGAEARPGDAANASPLDDAPAPREPVDAPWTSLRTAMWQHAGIVRDAAGLEAARVTCDEVASAATGATPQHMRLRRAARTAALICDSALTRTESRGAHFRSDFPLAAKDWHGVVVMHHERRDARVHHA